jgi:20S proteasome alpha/beta subunit
MELKLSTALLFLLTVYHIVGVGCHTWLIVNNLAVTSGMNWKVKKADAVVEFDEYGGLPQLENVYRGIQKASTVIALRTENATLFSYQTSNASSLQIPMGGQALNTLVNPWQHLLITGLSGDARLVVRHAKEWVLNHTVAYDSAPSGKLIAHAVGRYLQSFTMGGGTRPLCCHVFIADGLREGALYEIDAAGSVAQIWAGVAGRYMVKGRQLLEDRLNGTAIYSVGVAKELAELILRNGQRNVVNETVDSSASEFAHFLLPDSIQKSF